MRVYSAAITIFLLITAQAAGAAECGMRQAFNQPNPDSPGGKVAVWTDSLGKSLFFIAGLKTNTDGAKRSYSVTDFWGEDTALNNLCNAMDDSCGGLDSAGKRQRRILTQRARADGWPADELQATRISSSIIPFSGGKPCPEVDGFLVSSTALENPSVSNVCDPSRYVDAIKTPALVIPKGASGFAGKGAAKGDLVVAVRPGSHEPVFAIVGDLGPANKLGEGSIALAGRLLGKTTEPKNYKEIKTSWQVPKALVLVFPRSRHESNPFSIVAELDSAGAAAVSRLGRLGAAAGLRGGVRSPMTMGSD
jgi:hypothetical protein